MMAYDTTGIGLIPQRQIYYASSILALSLLISSSKKVERPKVRWNQKSGH